jgi:hypothetical protein
MDAPEEVDEFAPIVGGGGERSSLRMGQSFGTSSDLEIWALQSWYEYLSILTMQGRSFCAWIVNKTWWDVTYDILKYTNVADNYYTIAFLLTGAAAVCPLVLYEADATLIRAVFCGKEGVHLDPLKKGFLQRSLSRSEEDGLQNGGTRSYSGLGPMEGGSLSDGDDCKAGGEGGAGLQMVSIAGMMSGPAAGEGGDGEVAALRRRNSELEAQLVALRQQRARPRDLV